MLTTSSTLSRQDRLIPLLDMVHVVDNFFDAVDRR